MNTQKQIFVMIVMLVIFTGGCAAYAAIDLPIRAGRQADFFKSESVERGALLYANNCRSCHGVRGEGGAGPPVNNDEFKDQDPNKLADNRAMLTRTLTCGRAGTLMPAWLTENGGSLNAIQIEHIIDLITSPVEDGFVDSKGNLTSKGWHSAEEFSHNLNSDSSVIIGGNTLSGIAKVYGIGPDRLASENGLSLDASVKKGDVLTLPVSGTRYEVGDGDTLSKISNRQHVGAMILADLNGIGFAIDEETGAFVLTYGGSNERLMLDPEEGNHDTGLMPGTTLTLSENATYAVIEGDSFESIAKALGVTAAAVAQANGVAEDVTPAPETVIQLPSITAYPVVVQSLADAAKGFSAVSARTLAAANDLDPEEQLPVGKVLEMPGDAAGGAPPTTQNDGIACVEHIVTSSAFDEVMGTAFVFEKPGEVTTTLNIVAHANDWTFQNDGSDQTPNEGAALIAAGTTVTFENVEPPLHSIDVDDESQKDPFLEGETFSVTFSEPGEYAITCWYHPDMNGRIYVE